MFPVRYEYHLHIKKVKLSLQQDMEAYVFTVRYEHHLQIKKYSYTCDRQWRPICMFPVRYEHKN
jgi:hypothetical protein